MYKSTINQLVKDGFAVVEDFMGPVECDELVKAGYYFCDNLPTNEHKTIFSTNEAQKHQIKEKYFLESNDKISVFYEQDAVDTNGQLKVDPKIALNKVGHALHLLHPLFRCYTYCDRVKELVNELGFKEPAVVQSMYIFKNPGIGGEVAPHQDATYLYTDPVPAVGFWIALEDATIQNGCLWIAKGSHKSGVHRRLVRNPDWRSKEILIYDRPASIYSPTRFKPVPVRKGTLILLHGHVVHKSAHNMSRKSRPAYTFHVIEKADNVYDPMNWLQEGKKAPFLNIYETPQTVWKNNPYFQSRRCTILLAPTREEDEEESDSDDNGKVNIRRCTIGLAPTEDEDDDDDDQADKTDADDSKKNDFIRDIVDDIFTMATDRD